MAEPAPDGGAPLETIARSLRAERDRAGLTLSEVAKRAGVAKSTLSQLESGTANPSVETLWAVATAIGVPFALLVDPPAPTVQVIRAGDGPAIRSHQADYVATLLAASPRSTRRDIYRLTMEPGGARCSEPHAAGTVEHMIVSTGRAVAGPTEEPVELGPGDYIAYPGDAPHICRALEPGTTAVLVSELG